MSYTQHLGWITLALIFVLWCGVTVGLISAAPVDVVSANEIASEIMAYFPDSVQAKLQGTGFPTASIQSFLMILVTELGDKTFFIAAIMAMKHSRGLVLTGALLALYVMTVLSVIMGKAFPLLFDKKYTSLIAGLLFLYFGLSLLRDWYKSRNETEGSEELQEVEEELSLNGGVPVSSSKNDVMSLLLGVFSPIFLRSFMLTFLAEWGDRSQIATIAFAAAKNAYGVILGCILGHTLCTGLAVMGGRMLASRISERAVTLIGGLTFLVFGGLTLFSGDILE
mmetsp:Transcript_12070/g.20625  ORF Transcript_12070/g.20625 Transcript_12070/m.20625 type:complete len:281 (+) Transcript_12070:1437-2279(+)